MTKSLMVILACCLLASCGGGDGNDDSQAPDVGAMNVDDYTDLSSAQVEPRVLKPATEEELLNQLKNGMRLQVTIGSSDSTAVVDAINAVDNETSRVQELAGDSEFSSTNTHVRGVDESDFVKYDGLHLYMATHPEYLWGEDRPNAFVRILQTDPANANITEVGSIALPNDERGEVRELYLDGDTEGTNALVTLRSSWNYIAAAEPLLTDAIFDIWPFPMENKVQIASYDVRDPSNPERDFTLEIDGYLQSSRKIGNTLYLVTHFSPYVPFIQYFFEDRESAQENEERIAALGLTDLLPQVSINGNMEQALHSAEDCLVPVDLAPAQGYHNIISLIAIDIQSQEITSTKCLNAEVSGIYANENSLYLGGSSFRSWETFDSFSVIHKFTLGDAINYRSTGMLEGTLGWDDPSFRMDEHQGSLRVVTTSRSGNGDPEHRLSVLQDSTESDEMEIVATLPNDQRPAPIGKPNEDIYAVRFIGDRGYIVTFERIDPLYVLDLADPLDPRIAGELEVPGFATYLHPVGDDFLLGIGQDADTNGLAQGVKTSLYDVSDISAPSLITSETFGERGTWSSALYDLRAISFLAPTEDQLRFAFPMSLYTGDSWEEESLYLFEINGVTGSADMQHVGRIIAENKDDTRFWPSVSGTDRSVLHDEAVYYTHGNDVWAAFWSDPQGATGPH